MRLLSGIFNIKKDIEDILVFSQSYPFKLNASELAMQWKTAKNFFIKRFNGNTIVRSDKKISIHLTNEQKTNKFNNFINELTTKKLITDELKDFLTLNKIGLFENKVAVSYPSKEIYMGSKLSKAIKKFFSEAKDIELVQSMISRLVQVNKIDGYLYLSVDPKDYLLLSENNSNWESCQSLDGEFRTGNLSYMVDTTTIVAYIANEVQENMKCIPKKMKWYNKKWRVLIHIDPKRCFYLNRRYPFDSIELEEEVYNFITKIFNLSFTKLQDNFFRSTNNPNFKISSNQIYVGSRVFDSRDIFDTTGYLGFCDLIDSIVQTPLVAVENERYSQHISKCGLYREIEEISFHKLYDITIGDFPICPCCGKNILDRTDSFLCNVCRLNNNIDRDFYTACSCCGRKFYENDIYFLGKDKELYCKKCFNSISL